MSTLAQETNLAPATNKKPAVSPNSNFVGAAGQCAVAIGASLNNFYKFLRQYALQKAAETKNTLTAAQSQAESMLQAGKKQMLGSIFMGAGEIASGVVGLGGAAYSGYQTAKTSTQFNELNTKAPQILDDLSEQRGQVPLKVNGNVTQEEFSAFLKDPRIIENDPDLSVRLRGHNFTREQEASFNEARQQFSAGKAPLQKELKANLQELKSSTAGAEQSFQFFARGMGSLGQGVYAAKAAADNSAATLAEAARSMASGAIDVTGQAISQIERLIEALYQTIGTLANVNRG
ncbi:MAG: hypothetical protein IT584_03125 [Chlamydiae bacterium]|nr:hypothetical protein [Chlamydiota bacterium]